MQTRPRLTRPRSRIFDGQSLRHLLWVLFSANAVAQAICLRKAGIEQSYLGRSNTQLTSTVGDIRHEIQIQLIWALSNDNVGVKDAQFAQTASTAQAAGPLAAPGNPNYFSDASGNVLILNGSQTWNTLQDWGSNGSPQILDFNAFINFLTAHGHNSTLLWRTELPKFCGFPAAASSPPDLTVSPHPWLRTGPGNATDGALKFDLTKFDQRFFDRLRTRTQALSNAGIYAGVYLFTGEWLNIFRCSSDGYPFTAANNINRIDDGYAGGSKGTGSVTMTAPNAITGFQDAYVEKVIDTLNDLPNVLWIVSEEAPPNSRWWNSHQISHIRAYESGKPHQHSIGYAALIGPGSSDMALYNSNADWVAPSVRISPATSCGSGIPACKVNINDSDHSYWEMWK